ncbi:MAG TPA: chromate transporter [Acidothermaceae bacterium]
MAGNLLFFLLLLKASFLSSGGLANLPSVHQDLISRQWAHEGQFVEALAIGQLAPGPTGLWVVALGYLARGPSGALLAAGAITIPPLLALPMDRLYRRLANHRAVEGFVFGLILAAAGSVMAVLAEALRSYGVDLATVLIFTASVVLVGRRILPRGFILLLSAAVGFAVWVPR